MKRLIVLSVAVVSVCNVVAVEHLRLVSYNVQHCLGKDKHVDCARTAAAIMKENPDFVGLQELDVNVKRSGLVDEPAELARLAGYHATFAKAIDCGGGEYGVAVLSREKPLSVRRIPLPGLEPRVLLLCEFTNCWFGTTHLDSGTLPGESVPSHIASVPVIRKAVMACAVVKPVFLTGDWNAKPDSELVAKMCGFMTILSDSNKPTIRSMKRCIDYVTVDSAHATGVRLQDRHVTIDFETSDHHPVVVAVELVAGPE